MLQKIQETTGKIKESVGKNIDYFKPWKTVPAFVEAWKKAREAKDKSFFEKVGIFWESFKNAVKGIEKEKKEVSAETRDQVEKGVDETLKDTKEAVALSDEVQDKDREVYEEVSATLVSSFEELDEAHQGYALTGVKKVAKASEGKDAKNLDADELSALAAVGMLTLAKLKAQYPNKAKFKGMLKHLQKASDKSKYPLSKLLSNSVLRLFKLKDEEEGLKLLKAIGITPSRGDLAGMGDASEAKDVLTSLGKGKLERSDENKLVKFFRRYIFKKTSDSNVRKAVVLINKMIRGGSRKISVDQLTDLVFYIDNQDYTRMARLLVGKKRSEYVAAAE